MTPENILPSCVCGNAECSVPYGLCHCRCGEPTNIHTKNDVSRGRVKGQPAKFVRRHQYRLEGSEADYFLGTGQKKWPDGFNSCPLCGARKGRQNEMCSACRKGMRRPVEQPDDPSYRFIPLSQGQLAIVDTCDYDYLMQWKWFARWCEDGKCFYAVMNLKNSEGKKCMTFMHRDVLRLSLDDPRTGDHALHNPLDQRRFVDGKENLRISFSMSEQAFNKRRRRDNQSGYKGVTLHKKSGLYMAKITAYGKFIYLGYRKTAEAAYRELYVPAAMLYHGKFAYLDNETL